MSSSENAIVQEKQEVEYPMAPLHKRWFAVLIDIVITLTVGLLLYGLMALVTNQVPSYQAVVEERDELQKDNALYVDGQQILVYDFTEASVEEKKAIFHDAIEDFYHDERYFKDLSFYQEYQGRKKEAQFQGEYIFAENKVEKGIYEETFFSAQIYYDFYYSEIEKHCMGFLTNNEAYERTTFVIFNTFIIELFLSTSVSFLLFFVGMPLIFKRGRKTLGMFMFKISLIGPDAINVKGVRLLSRFLWLYFVGFVLDVFTVFIPLAVSITMMHLSKAHQSFFDYMSNTYMVDTSKKDVYLSEEEYYSRKAMREESSIENNTFHLDK